MTEIFFKEESYQIIGACIEVHRKLGAGFLESVYAEALEIEFKKMNIPSLNNIKATKFKLGLLINFGTPSLTYKRILN
jgi:hypothetical protein